MRLLAYLLILIGLIYIADAAYDEHRGVADALSPQRGGRHYVFVQADEPEQFRNLMTSQWYRGPIFVLGGLFLLGVCRRADRSDPFSPNFGGSDALDEWNRALKDEEKRRHRPSK